MKKLLIVLLSIGLALGASAQKVVGRGGGHFYRPAPRVIVSPGFGFGYGYGPFSPYYGFYNPWYYPPYGYYNYRTKPSRLDLEIQDIRTDYSDRIKSVRLNTDIPKKERRQKVRELKTERDKEILQAKKDYYYKRPGPGKSSDNSSNGNNKDSNNY